MSVNKLSVKWFFGFVLMKTQTQSDPSTHIHRLLSTLCKSIHLLSTLNKYRIYIVTFWYFATLYFILFTVTMSHQHSHLHPSKKPKATKSPPPDDVSLFPEEIWGAILPFCDDPELLAVRATSTTLHRLVHPLLLAKTEEPFEKTWQFLVLPFRRNRISGVFRRSTCQVRVQPPPSLENANKNLDTLLQQKYQCLLQQMRERAQVQPSFFSFNDFKDKIEKSNAFTWRQHEDRYVNGGTDNYHWRIRATVETSRRAVDNYVFKRNRKTAVDYDDEERVAAEQASQVACWIRYRFLERNFCHQYEHSTAAPIPAKPVEYLMLEFGFSKMRNWGEGHDPILRIASFSAVNLSTWEELDLVGKYEDEVRML